MMDIYASDNDKISLLISDKTTTYPSRSSYDQLSDAGQTIHYLSPASTTIGTLDREGGFDYHHLLTDLHRKEPLPVYSESTTSTISCADQELQRTIAILKPEALEFEDVVIRTINMSGLKIVNRRYVHLTPEQVADIYKKYYGNPVFPHMVVSVSVSPVIVLSLQGINAVEKWKTMVGPYKVLHEEWFFPYTVQTRFGCHEDLTDVLHASENLQEASNENRFFYPKSILEPLVTIEEQVTDFITVHFRPTLVDGLTELVRKRPADPIIFLAEWLLLHNPNQPRLPYIITMTQT